MEQYGLTGNPLGHSVSPEIHRRLFALEGIDAAYSLFPIEPQAWDAHLPALLALRGFNVTLPYKERILPALTHLHESAAFYGAVNTVLRLPGGTHRGYNTDCDGFLQTMHSHDIPLTGTVCVLGAGGVGRMFALECARQGARVTLAVRESAVPRADALAREAQEKLGTQITVTNIAALDSGFDLLINATPVGMHPNTNACPVQESVVAACRAVFDCIYNPGETKLLSYAKQHAVKAAGGMDMLVWQAVAAHQYWHETTFEHTAITSIITDMTEVIANQ